MTEKVRALNLTSGSMLASQHTTPTSLIGPPTLISSTFNLSGKISTATACTPAIASSASVNATSAPEGDSDLSSATALKNSAPTFVDVIETKNEFDIASVSGPITTAELQYHILPLGTTDISTFDGALASSSADITAVSNSMMNSSQISTISNDSAMQSSSQNVITGSTNALKPNGGKHLPAQSVAGKSCRFPKLEDCAHFHYERVQLGPLSVRLVDDKSELLNSSIASQSIGGDIATSQTSATFNNGPSSLRAFSPTTCWFIIKVFPHRCEPFLVKRSYENMQMLDEMLHRCVYDRKISGLKNLNEIEFKTEEEVEYAVAKYLERFSKIASDSLTCGTILTWLQLDNKGRRLPLADGDTQRTINTPAVGAAYGVRRYQAQAADEISIEVGDMISVIDMPSPAESIWWRGKKSHLQKSQYEVGFFPQSCVATIGDKVPRYFPMPAPLVGQLDVSPTKPVLRKHGKLIAFFRSFILSRPSRRRLKQSGIYRERVFSCDLSEHLLNSGQEIPMVLKCCAEFIEEYGIVDGIYRLSGITSNIQRLRRAFDEERVPDLGNPEMKQDIHAVSSLLKMYFRELPNPLCTYQLYDNFVEAIQAKSESTERLRLMKETVLKLPPPHYRTLKYLAEHLNKISQHSPRTGMTDKNLAIVWAPNLLRSPALESGGVAALRGVGVQAVVTEYLIRNCNNIFDALDDCPARLSFIATTGATPANEARLDSLTDCESLLVEQREHDQSLTFVERPKSLSASGPKLISLEEAQERHSRVEGFDIKQSMPISMVASNASNIGSYIEVGGGPSSLPDKYHTVLSVPRSWQKRKTHSWKSLFTRTQRPVSGNGPHEFRSAAGKTVSIDSAPTQRKESSQVTFADNDLIIAGSSKTGKSSLQKQEKPKSIELFETTRDVNKPMEVCVRSSSIDSLRTAGHSRSVSHDSYFDLLQSPQRSHPNYPSSRELSELGLNFDREEPEMHLFSESESLVSSPRVGKENMPPASGYSTRRVLRARPEEFSSQTNSVNPSPKKQPRLNLLLSPSTASANQGHAQNWSNDSSDGVDAGNTCQEHVHHSNDESCCKRYKLEDQLSDIQFIDCGTPEHTIANPQTLFANAQIHAPPKPALSRSGLYGSKEFTAKREELENNEKSSPQLTGLFVNSRYSYPSVLLGSKRNNQECLAPAANANERFSYPGSNARYNNQDQSRENPVHSNNIPDNGFGIDKKRLSGGAQQPNIPKPLPCEFLNPRNRNSYCGSSDLLNMQLLRSNSADTNKDTKTNDIMERSKLSVTPSSPMQSPRYSLLVGDTSSENSSAVNTPQHDLDPLMIGSSISGFSGVSGLSGNSSNHQQHQKLLLEATSSYIGTSRESLGSNITSNSNNIITEKRDMSALKRELSLDLSQNNMKIGIDTSNERGPMHSSNKQIPQHVIPSPNNSNFTDNTSQSVTPSEYGYQHLQRQLSMHSLIETDENSPTYEDYENTPSNLISPLSGHKLPSPIKSTISITYNLKSPVLGDQTIECHQTKQKLKHVPKSKPKTLLETSFDENTVYEQVKLLRDSVTEVNQLLNSGRNSGVQQNENKESEAAHMIQPKVSQINRNADVQDIQMSDNHADSLEPKSDNEKLMYQNVQLRKPKSIYENLRGEDMKAYLDVNPKDRHNMTNNDDKADLDSLDSIETNAGTVANNHVELQVEHTPARKSPSNFSVKELANKFESSPVEQLAPFDFSVRSSMKKLNSPVVGNFVGDNINKPSISFPDTEKKQLQSATGTSQQQTASVTAPNACSSNTPTGVQMKQKLNKTQQITRSLDENAFVREFGAKHLQDFASTRSTQQIPEMSDVNNRRKSFDFTRPKTLNPPKRLPGMPITEETFSKNDSKSTDHDYNDTLKSNGSNISAFFEHDFESSEMKVTPTTENRMSLLQNNSTALNTVASALDLNNSNLNHSTNSLKVLSGVKLDRERIDRIKEERRQQLTQKYHTDTLKSRSKTDLNSTAKDDDKKFDSESIRVKSKSRGDIRTIQKDIDNLKEFSRSAASMHAASESTLNSESQIYGTHRIRSISDEKNENCDTSVLAAAPAGLKLAGISNISNDGLNVKKFSPTQPSANQEEYSARATVQKFERKSLDFANGTSGGSTREWSSNRSGSDSVNNVLLTNRNSLTSTREKISPQFSIRDVTAMFESRSQNQ